MRLLLVGGGKVGSYLARELEHDGHVVTVIEENAQHATALAESSESLVFHGDGTEVGLLRSAGVERADWVVAVTGRDEINLVACQLGLTLGAKRALARLNDPRNRPTFDAMEIPVVAVTDLLGEIISQEVIVDDLRRITLLGGGRISLIERTVGEAVQPTPLSAIDLPQPAVLVAIVRNREVFVPTAATKLESGDRVLAVTAVENESALSAAIDALGEGRRP